MTIDAGIGRDTVMVQRPFTDKGNWRANWVIRKYADDEAFARDEAYAESYVPENILLNDGIARLLDLLIGAGGNAYNNANARIGVGDSTAAEDASQTGLQGTSTAFKGMDTDYPQRSGQTVSFRATFGPAEANFDWREFVVDNGTETLNRRVSNQGTKISGQTWTITLEITIS